MNLIKGLIKKQISNRYTVIDLETKKEYEAFASGRLRFITVDEDSSFNRAYGRRTKKDKRTIQISPKVGDKVSLNISDDTNIIEDISPRINDLTRPDVANVDQVLLVFSSTKPEFSFNLLDKFLVILSEQNLKVKLVVSKIDLISEKELNMLKEKLKYYQEKVMIDIYFINSKQRIGFDVLENVFKNKITVLAGQTGVGKSTLLNALIPELRIKTQEISEALGRGKHTTRHSELYEFNNGYICDTPGFSRVEFGIYEKDELRLYYDDFYELSSECRFNTCNHINEAGCKIKEEVELGNIPLERYENYVLFYEEIASNKNKF